MENKEKLAILEEIMELDEGTLKESDILEEYDEWDSITALSLIAVVGEKFGRTITGKEIKEMQTVADVLAVMER